VVMYLRIPPTVRSPYTVKLPENDPLEEAMLGAVTEPALKLLARYTLRQEFDELPKSNEDPTEGMTEVANEPILKDPVMILDASKVGRLDVESTPPRFEAFPEEAIEASPLS
jgi:hypothetical protein